MFIVYSGADVNRQTSTNDLLLELQNNVLSTPPGLTQLSPPENNVAASNKVRAIPVSSVEGDYC